MLATGRAAVDRLSLLHEIFGPATAELLRAAGLSPGMRVAEFGCGNGLTALWMADVVGSDGSVTALDLSNEQLQVAEQNAAAAGQSNISFQRADAYESGLPRDTFDLVFSRFLLCHLTEPGRAITEMGLLLKPNGVLVCEDHDDGGIFTEPPTNAYKRLVEISEALNRAHGLDSYIGLKLPRLIRDAGFRKPEVRVCQHAVLQGPAKRLWEITLEEARPSILAANVATSEELESICSEMRGIANDESILLMLARVSQVWAKK